MSNRATKSSKRPASQVLHEGVEEWATKYSVEDLLDRLEEAGYVTLESIALIEARYAQTAP